MSLILILLFRNVWIGVMAAIVLFALGILTQYTLTKKKREVSSMESQPMKVVSQEGLGNTQTVNAMLTMNETSVLTITKGTTTIREMTMEGSSSFTSSSDSLTITKLTISGN